MSDLHEMAGKARQAFYVLSTSSLEKRNEALARMAEELEAGAQESFRANEEDLREAEAEQLATPLLKRLKFGREKMAQVIEGLHSLAGLPDPLGKTTLSTEITEGLKLYRVTCAIGVLGRPCEKAASMSRRSSSTIFFIRGFFRCSFCDFI